MNITLTPELIHALKQYAADNSRSWAILTPEAAAIEILEYFLKKVKL